jgi:hypothetical protein
VQELELVRDDYLDLLQREASARIELLKQRDEPEVHTTHVVDGPRTCMSKPMAALCPWQMGVSRLSSKGSGNPLRCLFMS